MRNIFENFGGPKVLPDANQLGNKNDKKGSQEIPLTPEEKEKLTRETRKSLTNEFVGRTKYLPEGINKSIKEAVISGDFKEVDLILNSLIADVDRLKGYYDKDWRELGPDGTKH